MTDAAPTVLHDDRRGERIEQLKQAVTPMDARDSMAEAGRKALLADFIAMLKHEAGSRTGEDIKHVHDMRVAIRRMRSTLDVLSPYFKGKRAARYSRRLQTLATALGRVRDLDVLIASLSEFQATTDGDLHRGLAGVIDILEARRVTARHKLVSQLDRRGYRRFVDEFGDWLTHPKAAKDGLPAAPKQAANGSAPVPIEVRHILPAKVYEQVGVIRAYDAVVDEADDETLHQLRIEFKRLRYLVAIFADLMGKPGKAFIDELKLIQDHLGRLNDDVVAQSLLRDLLPDLDDAQANALERYLERLAAEEVDLKAKFPEAWRRFNSKPVQRNLGAALAEI